MKTILIHLEDAEYKQILKLKGSMTWKEFMFSKAGKVIT